MVVISGTFTTMPMSLLFPAVSMAIVVVATAWSLHCLGTELARLRLSLKRTGAAAVALDELGRETAVMAARIGSMRTDLTARVHWPRPRHAPTGR